MSVLGRRIRLPLVGIQARIQEGINTGRKVIHCICSVSNSIVNDKAVRARVIESPLLSTTRHPRNKGSYSPAMQNRYQVTVPSTCFSPPGQIVRRPGNLHSPPENSQPLEPINK